MIFKAIFKWANKLGVGVKGRGGGFVTLKWMGKKWKKFGEKEKILNLKDFIFVCLALSKILEAVTHRCSLKKVFLESSQYLQENTCVKVSFLIKMQSRSLQLF